jgi:hypothetical protein
MMTEKEFRKKMKELGWNDSFIDELVRIHDEELKKGVNIPYEANIVEAPINY